ncbi:MAG: GNAT family N-acetyltransferase [Acidobacteria bacterium]|nr:GNAT family N-acetyltransferase [Acidobacteriota bacterium]
MARYPKSVRLRDEGVFSIRPLRLDDFNAFLMFSRDIPPEDRLFLRRDVSDPEVVQKMIAESQSESEIWLVTLKDQRIVAQGSIQRSLHGWMRHVGEMRLVVARDFQRRGLGSLLARELFICAIGLKIEKVMAKMAIEQLPSIKCLEKLGFQKEVVLHNYIKDLNGLYHDMLIMSQEI